MTRMTTMLALIAGTALVAPAAYAQTTQAAGGPSPETAATTSETPDQGSQQTADAPMPVATEASSQAEFLQAQIEAMQAQIDALKKQVTMATPTFKGAPQWANDDGFSFKPKGYAQFDAGYVTTPGDGRNGTVGGLNYNNLGWNTRVRRVVLGAEGTLPGGFGYKVEFNLAQATVDYEDIVLTYQRAGSPFQITIGNFYPLTGLDTMTSSRLGSFMERSAANDAFGYNRRLGAAIGIADPVSDRYTLTGGVFSQTINDSTNFSRTGWQVSARGTFSPQIGPARLHLGANYQHRVAQRDAQNVQYRARPFTQLTDQRFIDTGLIAAGGDDIVGLELGGTLKSLHFAAEGTKVWVRGYAPGRAFGVNNGAAGGAYYGDDPSFWSAYGEVGYYLTGETRGYKGGKWERTKVLHPFDQGGIGAIQINGRVDYTNLNDRTGNGATLAAPNFINGGRQLAYEASVIWNPMDYIRFLAQYSHSHYNGGPRVTAIDPTGPALLLDRNFNVDQFGVRAQVDF